MKRVLSTLLAATAALFATATAGTVYNYETSNINQGQNIGKIEYLSVSYDTDDKLTFKTRLGKNAKGQVANGGWFVLSPGNNPKNSGNELAIFYMDFAAGDIYAYRYDGRKNKPTTGANSYKNKNRYITTYNDVLNVTYDANGVSLEINALMLSELAPGTFGKNWTGASFAEKMGAWIHFTAFDEFKLDKNGKIAVVDWGPQSWYDVAYKKTTKVSEPLGFAAAGLLLAGGLVGWRRRRQAA